MLEQELTEMDRITQLQDGIDQVSPSTSVEKRSAKKKGSEI